MNIEAIIRPEMLNAVKDALADAGLVGLNHFLVPVPRAHLVDGSLVGVKGHQMSRLSTHLPASIVGVDRERSWLAM